MVNIDFLGLLDSSGIMKPITTKQLNSFSNTDIVMWCHHNARYGLPTIELGEWLKTKINGRKVIEIGSGSGDLARLLNIRATDNLNQTFDDVRAYYELLQQPTIKYPLFVEKIDAITAIEKYRPQVVVASWITHWIDPKRPPPKGGGNMYGVKEDIIVDLGITYILIGNLTTHQYKPILKRPHLELKLPFVKSRSTRPDSDRIFIWNDKD